MLELQLVAERAPAEQEQARGEDAAASAAAIDLDEAATRILIDQQLRDAGWTVDSEELRYAEGVRHCSPLRGSLLGATPGFASRA